MLKLKTCLFLVENVSVNYDKFLFLVRLNTIDKSPSFLFKEDIEVFDALNVI